MAKRILITGGVRSGKSSAAEKYLLDSSQVVYIATARCLDQEMERRIALHQESRPSHWITAEASKNLSAILNRYPQGDVLLDCVSNMVTNLMLDAESDFDSVNSSRVEEIEKVIAQEFDEFMDTLETQNRTAVIVTNEVGYGLVSPYRMGRVFTDILGRINQRLASRCNEVRLMVCGLPVILKS